jgi:hypothetical protein
MINIRQILLLLFWSELIFRSIRSIRSASSRMFDPRSDPVKVFRYSTRSDPSYNVRSTYVLCSTYCWLCSTLHRGERHAESGEHRTVPVEGLEGH